MYQTDTHHMRACRKPQPHSTTLDNQAIRNQIYQRMLTLPNAQSLQHINPQGSILSRTVMNRQCSILAGTLTPQGSSLVCPAVSSNHHGSPRCSSQRLCSRVCRGSDRGTYKRTVRVLVCCHRCSREDPGHHQRLETCLKYNCSDREPLPK
jgi:hypothetical protein